MSRPRTVYKTTYVNQWCKLSDPDKWETASVHRLRACAKRAATKCSKSCGFKHRVRVVKVPLRKPGT